MLLTLRKIITMRVIEQAEDIIEREQLGDSILSYTTENFKILERKRNYFNS